MSQNDTTLGPVADAVAAALEKPRRSTTDADGNHTAHGVPVAAEAAEHIVSGALKDLLVPAVHPHPPRPDPVASHTAGAGGAAAVPDAIPPEVAEAMAIAVARQHAAGSNPGPAPSGSPPRSSPRPASSSPGSSSLTRRSRGGSTRSPPSPAAGSRGPQHPHNARTGSRLNPSSTSYHRTTGSPMRSAGAATGSPPGGRDRARRGVSSGGAGAQRTSLGPAAPTMPLPASRDLTAEEVAAAAAAAASATAGSSVDPAVRAQLEALLLANTKLAVDKELLVAQVRQLTAKVAALTEQQAMLQHELTALASKNSTLNTRLTATTEDYASQSELVSILTDAVRDNLLVDEDPAAVVVAEQVTHGADMGSVIAGAPNEAAAGSEATQ